MGLDIYKDIPFLNFYFILSNTNLLKQQTEHLIRIFLLLHTDNEKFKAEYER